MGVSPLTPDSSKRGEGQTRGSGKQSKAGGKGVLPGYAPDPI